MNATIVDLRYRMKNVLRAIDRGETVTILYRGKEKAKLMPITPASFSDAPKAKDQPLFGLLERPRRSNRSGWIPSRQPPRAPQSIALAKVEMIFDTDVLIWTSRGNLSGAAARTIDACPDRALSIVSLMELLQGARSKVEARQIQQSLRQLQFRILPLSEAIGAMAAALIEQHALAHGIQLADALIAATAMEFGHPLCTGNAKQFRPIRRLSCVAFRP